MTLLRTRASGLITFLVLAFGFAWLGMVGAWALWTDWDQLDAALWWSGRKSYTVES